MSAGPEGDSIIKDASGSSVCFIRDIEDIKKRLDRTIQNAIQIFAVIVVVTLIIHIIYGENDVSILSIMAIILSVGLPAVVVISSLYIRNRFILNSMCKAFTVFNDRIDIDGKEFELKKIRSAWMTPFEYYEKRYIYFEYEGKKYKYYFGKYNGTERAECFYKPYMQMNMFLESRGFLNKY